MLEHRAESHFDERMRHAAVSVLQSRHVPRVHADGRMSHAGATPWRMPGRKLSSSGSHFGTVYERRLRRTARVWRGATTQLSGSNVSGIRFTLKNLTYQELRRWTMKRNWC
jgi:hypothetical protein